jgi:hypothetical protein
MKKTPIPKTIANGISINSHAISLSSAGLMLNNLSPTFAFLQ